MGFAAAVCCEMLSACPRNEQYVHFVYIPPNITSSHLRFCRSSFARVSSAL